MSQSAAAGLRGEKGRTGATGRKSARDRKTDWVSVVLPAFCDRIGITDETPLGHDLPQAPNTGVIRQHK